MFFKLEIDGILGTRCKILAVTQKRKLLVTNCNEGVKKVFVYHCHRSFKIRVSLRRQENNIIKNYDRTNHIM